MRSCQTANVFPNKRLCELIEFSFDGFEYVATIGRFPNGEIAEVFLNSEKVALKSRQARATQRLLPASPCNTALQPRRSDARCRRTRMAACSALLALPWILLSSSRALFGSNRTR